MTEPSADVIDRIVQEMRRDYSPRRGFDAEWDVLPAAAFGSPQLRARLWILAYPSGNREQADATVYAGRGLSDVCPGWTAEPGVCRVADGIPASMDRLHGLGDSIVPQIAEWIGYRILEAEERLTA